VTVLTREQRLAGTARGSAAGVSIGIAMVVLAMDQATKRLATSTLSANPDGGPAILGGWFRLTYTTNSGAAFGVLADRSILFLLIAVVVLSVVVAYWRFLPTTHPALRVSLGLQLGGACGNLLDRVRAGYVVDFIEIRYWPVFNVADSAIVIGVLILVIYLLLGPDTSKASGTGDRPPEEER
jgi:signal peptidase II